MKAVLVAAALALTFHGAVIFGAVSLTRPAGDRAAVQRPDTVMIDLAWPSRPEPPAPPAPGPAEAAAAPEAGRVLAAAAMIDVPSGIRPVDTGPLAAAPLPVPHRRACPPAGCYQRLSRAIQPANPAPDARPEVLFSPEVRYPPALWAAGIEGVVVVRFVVDTLGRADPSTIEVVQSTNVGFNRPAKDMVRGSRFRPGLIAGTPARIRSKLQVAFTLSGVSSVGAN